jgi:hypothetical protein
MRNDARPIGETQRGSDSRSRQERQSEQGSRSSQERGMNRDMPERARDSSEEMPEKTNSRPYGDDLDSDVDNEGSSR